MKVEVDLEAVLSHLGGVDVSREFMLLVLRDRCGIFGERLAAQIEEQTGGPVREWSPGDVVTFTTGSGRVCTLLRHEGGWTASVSSYGDSLGWADDSVSALVDGTEKRSAEVLRYAKGDAR